MTTSWLDLWMGRQFPRHVDAVHDVSGFDLSFRDFINRQDATLSSGASVNEGSSGGSHEAPDG